MHVALVFFYVKGPLTWAYWGMAALRQDRHGYSLTTESVMRYVCVLVEKIGVHTFDPYRMQLGIEGLPLTSGEPSSAAQLQVLWSI